MGKAALRGPSTKLGLLAPLLAVTLFFAAPLVACANLAERNGFKLTPSLISTREILRGGPDRDGIPALSRPHYTAAARADWRDDELVIGVVRGDEARAYPIAILVWHELVNDELGGDPILVSYCPLCGTALVFDRRIDGGARNFGVSGLLYQSDMLMFDRETESLWSQIGANAVTGKLMGRRLDLLRSKTMTWKRWREAHPETTVLSKETGHLRDYTRTPYEGYETSNLIYFPVKSDTRKHPKEPTLGLRIAGGPSRAYPGEEIARAGGRVEDVFSGRPVTVIYDSKTKRFDFEVPDGIEVIEGFWFAWMAFHPESSVFVFSQPKS
ncbi:MAG: DUF3179 domain-containing protein [Deltaproteobacteria bacterium]|nr:DUF3179 domain-containing protein [Deltaproteobacteria bacterium]